MITYILVSEEVEGKEGEDQEKAVTEFRTHFPG
jgi:hypothetical protein